MEHGKGTKNVQSLRGAKGQQKGGAGTMPRHSPDAKERGLADRGSKSHTDAEW